MGIPDLGSQGAHGRDVGHPAQFSFCFFRNEKKRFKNIKKLISSSKGRPKLSQQGRQDTEILDSHVVGQSQVGQKASRRAREGRPPRA